MRCYTLTACLLFLASIQGVGANTPAGYVKPVASRKFAASAKYARPAHLASPATVNKPAVAKRIIPVKPARAVRMAPQVTSISHLKPRVLMPIKATSVANGGKVSAVQKYTTYTGVILGVNDQPLPGASVFVAGERTRSRIAVTNAEGVFLLTLPATKAPVKLTVSYIGMADAIVPITQESGQPRPVNITLNQTW